MTEDAESVTIRVRAYPTDDNHTNYLVECTDCGNLGIVIDAESDEFCLQHLESHGVDTSDYRSGM